MFNDTLNDMISVCMATYNGENYLREQIDSILVQLKDDDELIISDDGSTDSTISILNSYCDSRIKILINNGIHGVNANFENAIANATGDYIFLSDQDNVWLPGKVDACIEALENADCVVHDCIVTDQFLNVVVSSFFSERGSGNGFWKNIYKNTYLGCCMALKKDLINDLLPIPQTTAFFQDNWIGCIADLKYRLIFIPFKGILFRRHTNTTSSASKTSSFSRVRQLKNRLTQIGYVIRRLKFGHF